MNKINIVTYVLLMLSSALFAQKESVSAFYRTNMNIINPSYAGVDDQTLVTTTFRKQWTGIAEAPETQTVAISAPLTGNLGIGLSVINDRTFIEKQTYVGVDLSYRLKMSETANLYLGIKAGGNFYSVNTTGLQTYNVESDPALASISAFNPNVGVGALYKNEAMYLSLSVPTMFKTNRAKNDTGYAMVVSQDPRFFLSGGYDINFNSETLDLVLKPSVMLRYTNGKELAANLTTMLAIEEKFNIGLMYRTEKAYGFLASLGLGKHFLLGYAFETSAMSELASTRNTNEFLLQYKF
nr:PorP/SprF family type IX secretion system membrane protein [uncultured Flavobacterium sp.]